jgi:hypothetical protein
MYPISDTSIAIMPTLDYYGYEHEDAITGTCDSRVDASQCE